LTLPLTLTLAAYLLGATPTSLWVGKALFGVDLRREGSGNLGATNAFRVLGWKPALPVVLVDIGKGWVPVALFPLAVPEAAPWWLLVWGGAAILGHVFSFWAGFRGGKGIATSAGVFLALAPWATLVGLVVWVVVVAATRYVSLGSIGAALVLPGAVALTPHGGGGATVWFTLALAGFVVWAHRANIEQLLRGEENRFGRKETSVP
jgi:acyl phosphate:glycerol-3-phosphate acyltransferase